MYKNPFEILTDDIMANPDITEVVTVAGRSIRVGVSSLEFAPSVTDYGMDTGVSFYLTVKAADAAPLKRGSIVNYRGVDYKVEKTDTDSAGLTVSVYLGSLTRR